MPETAEGKTSKSNDQQGKLSTINGILSERLWHRPAVTEILRASARLVCRMGELFKLYRIWCLAEARKYLKGNAAWYSS